LLLCILYGLPRSLQSIAAAVPADGLPKNASLHSLNRIVFGCQFAPGVPLMMMRLQILGNSWAALPVFGSEDADLKIEMYRETYVNGILLVS
jgi:hypothetical protein